jgi:hypothetical protein
MMDNVTLIRSALRGWKFAPWLSPLAAHPYVRAPREAVRPPRGGALVVGDQHCLASWRGNGTLSE